MPRNDEQILINSFVLTPEETPQIDTRYRRISTPLPAPETIADLRRAKGAASSDDEIKEINGTKFIGKVLDGFPPKDLKPMADDLKQKLGSGIVALVATNDGKASIVVAVTNDLTDKYNAVDLVRIGSEALGGKGGGGRPDMAQAGGPDAANAGDAVTKLEQAV